MFDLFSMFFLGMSSFVVFFLPLLSLPHFSLCFPLFSLFLPLYSLPFFSFRYFVFL